MKSITLSGSEYSKVVNLLNLYNSMVGLRQTHSITSKGLHDEVMIIFANKISETKSSENRN